jgi:hypothetical protein
MMDCVANMEEYFIRLYPSKNPKFPVPVFRIPKPAFIFINPLTLELNPSAQPCLMKFFSGDFVS